MRLWLRILLMNAAALAGCFLILTLIPGAMRLSVAIIAAVLALGLVNVIAVLVPQLYRSRPGRGPGEGESTNILLTLLLLILAGVLAWLSRRN
jgi:hypothetical protein